MRGIISPDFTLKAINAFQRVIKILIEFFDKHFGVFGKYIVSPAIKVLAITVYLSAFIIGVIVALAMWITRNLLKKIKALINYTLRSTVFWAILYFSIVIVVIIKNPVLYLIVTIICTIALCLICRFDSRLNTPHRRR